jgi:HEAT repeat protein
MILLIAATALACAAAACQSRSKAELQSSRIDSAAAVTAARDTLFRQARSSDAEARTRAIETLGLMVGPEAGPVLLENLKHPAVAVRFSAAMACGDTRYAPAAPHMRELLTTEGTDQNIQCAAIFCLHRLGDDTHMDRLAKILYDGSPEARANAALVMGKLGLQAGVKPLYDRLNTEHDSRVQFQIAESLAALKYERSYGLLTSKAWVGDPSEQLMAVEALGRMRSEKARGDLIQAFEPDHSPPVRLAAAAGLGRMGDNRGAALALESINDPDQVARECVGKRVHLTDPQKAQYQTLAALALGEMNQPGAVDVLMKLLNDKDPTVTIAAAKSILNLLAPTAPVPPLPAAPAHAAAATVPASQPARPAPTAGTPSVLRVAPPRE